VTASSAPPTSAKVTVEPPVREPSSTLPKSVTSPIALFPPPLPDEQQAEQVGQDHHRQQELGDDAHAGLEALRVHLGRRRRPGSPRTAAG
jgi:hypothetical protein